MTPERIPRTCVFRDRMTMGGYWCETHDTLAIGGVIGVKPSACPAGIRERNPRRNLI